MLKERERSAVVTLEKPISVVEDTKDRLHLDKYKEDMYGYPYVPDEHLKFHGIIKGVFRPIDIGGNNHRIVVRSVREDLFKS